MASNNSTSTTAASINVDNVTTPALRNVYLRELVSDIYQYYLSMECIFILPIVIGNLLILTSIARFRKLRGRMHVLIGNLAVSDLLVGLIVIPMDIYILRFKRLRIPKMLCLVRGFTMNTLIMASVLNLFLISLERYAAIVHPIRHKHSLTRGRLLLISIACWALAIIVGVLPVLGWNNWRPRIVCIDELVLPAEYSGLVTLILVSSLFANFFMYITVSRIAWHQVERSRSMVTFMNDGKEENNSQRFQQARNMKNIRKTKLMIFVLGIFSLCWGPYCVGVILMAFIFKTSDSAVLVLNLLASFGTMNSGLNWIVFGLKNPEFRKAFMLICRRDKTVDSSIDLGTASTDM